jgi:hypothetical protein
MTYPKLSFLLSFFVVFVFVLVSGCSHALVERMSTESFVGKGMAPFKTERALFDGAATRVGLIKLLTVHNPTSSTIKAYLSCASIYQADFYVTVKAHTRKWQLVGANNGSVYGDACSLVDWQQLESSHGQ